MVETAIAEEQLCQKMYSSYVPDSVQPSVFVTFVYDNCDHNPETLSRVTMHCTNCFIIQQITTAQEIQQLISNQIPSKEGKRRSLIPVTKELGAYYAPSKRVNPPLVEGVEVSCNEIYNAISKKNDFLWLLSRYFNEARNEDQVVPNWSGFHYEVAPEDEQGLHTVHYLPAIDGSPTKMEVIQELLSQIKIKPEQLGLKSVMQFLTVSFMPRHWRYSQIPSTRSCRILLP